MDAGSFPRESGRGVVLTTHLLAPRLRLSSAIPPLPLWALGGLLQVELSLQLSRAWSGVVVKALRY
jgi:hypothetical protein